MNPERFQQIRRLFDAAQEQSPADVDRWLAEAAPKDPDLQAAIHRLLVASRRGTKVLEKPPSIALLDIQEPQPVDSWFQKPESRRLGPYEIEHQIGEGGMGVVYLARRADGMFEKKVAIKAVRPELATPNFIARFEREREILGRLDHPHIAGLLDGGTFSGTGSSATPIAYLVMEYVKGEPLLEYAESRKLPFSDRMTLLRQIADAVDYAHAQGVIHRDLKPSNIFVTRDGQTKLLDFGIAAWQSANRESDAKAITAPTIALSPAYASPEQVLGVVTTKASDIYSLAMVAYELLSGVMPFPVEKMSLEAVLQSVVKTEPVAPSVAVRRSANPRPEKLGTQRQMPPWQLIDNLEKTVDRPLLEALSKDPQRRPVSAGILLDRLQGGDEEPAPPWYEVLEAELQQQVEPIALVTLLGALSVMSYIQLSTTSWVSFGLLILMLILRRTPFGRQRSKATIDHLLFIPLAVIAFVTAGAAPAERMRGAVVWGIPLLVATTITIVFSGLKYKSMGPVIFRENDGRFWYLRHLRGKIWLILTLVSIGLAVNEPFRFPFLIVMLVGMNQQIRVFEVREHGFVISGMPFPWDVIHGFRSKGGGNFELDTGSPLLLSATTLKIQVHTKVEQKVLEIFRDRLMSA